MTLYEVLNVSPNADQAQIRKEYRRLAREVHPDMSKLHPEVAKQRFSEIAQAYEILGNADSRRSYDRSLLEPIRSTPNVQYTPPDPSYTYEPRSYEYVKWDRDRIDYEWAAFASRPFAFSSKARSFLSRFEWLFGLGVFVVGVYIFVTEGLEGLMSAPMLFVLTSVDHPEGSINPLIGLGVGEGIAMLIVASMSIHAKLLRRSGHGGQGSITKQADATFTPLVIILGIIGIGVGHFFF